MIYLDPRPSLPPWVAWPDGAALHKQLSFELGEVYMEMMDMKFARMDGKIEEDPSQ